MQIATKVSRHEENWHERIPQKRNGGKCEIYDNQALAV